jgi:hypothetical protein
LGPLGRKWFLLAYGLTVVRELGARIDDMVTDHESLSWTMPPQGGSLLELDEMRRSAESYGSSSQKQVLMIWRTVRRFGLEPSWALLVLDSLRVPAARALIAEAKTLDARWVGRTIAWVLAALAFGLVAIVEGRTPRLIYIGGVAVVLLLHLLAARNAGRAVFRHEAGYYPRVERLLELHRFDLYQALAVKAPRSSDEEQKGPLAAWRLGEGALRYEVLTDTSDARGVRDEVANLTELLRGPELVSYDGYVSWQTRLDSVELAFARTPLLDDGYARLQVSGSAAEAVAPFDITANSSTVALANVRTTLGAPVDGSTARTTFNFRREDAAGDAKENEDETAELWFEISQRGRFIQLLRVRVALTQPPKA